MSSLTRTTSPIGSPIAGEVGPYTSPVGRNPYRTAVHANLVLRFALELASYAALGYWGSTLGNNAAGHVALAVLVPAAAMAVWVTFLAPKARRRLADPGGLALELVVFLGASAAAAVSVSLAAGLALGALAAANAVSLRVFGSEW